MSLAVVLDAAAFDILDSQRATGLRALLRRAIDDGGEVRCAAVTLAEVCRGVARTRRVEAALARRRGGQRIRIVPTDERFAKLVGAILHDTGSGSERIADAHVVAACTTVDAAIVLTADPDDIAALSAAVPATRIVTRDPRAPL
ncbi:MAG: PIN domain-containing protein [Pseudonocardiaceae bacterium]